MGVNIKSNRIKFYLQAQCMKKKQTRNEKLTKREQQQQLRLLAGHKGKETTLTWAPNIIIQPWTTYNIQLSGRQDTTTLDSVITIIRKCNLLTLCLKIATDSNRFGQHDIVANRVSNINNAFGEGMTIAGVKTWDFSDFRELPLVLLATIR